MLAALLEICTSWIGAETTAAGVDPGPLPRLTPYFFR